MIDFGSLAEEQMEKDGGVMLNKKVGLGIETQDDMLYTSYIYIGNPPQKMKALFDTGSASSWVAGDKVRGTYAKQHSYYEPSKSNTSIITNQTGHSFYGSGNCGGRYHIDDVRLGLNPQNPNATSFDKLIHISNFQFGVMER